MNNIKRGFTLLELLIVIAIISIMAAIILPVMASARRNAHRAVSTSNLKQCGMALLMYCDDYGGVKDMPSGEVAAQLVLKRMPTCDPNDTWRSSCSEDFGKPLIGSYGYINNLGDIDNIGPADWHIRWLLYLSSDQPHNLLASIFYADPIPVAFHGIERNPLSPECVNYQTANNCRAPSRVLRFRLDGSVKLEKMNLPPGRPDFSWLSVISLNENSKFGVQP